MPAAREHGLLKSSPCRAVLSERGPSRPAAVPKPVAVWSNPKRIGLSTRCGPGRPALRWNANGTPSSELQELLNGPETPIPLPMQPIGFSGYAAAQDTFVMAYSDPKLARKEEAP